MKKNKIALLMLVVFTALAVQAQDTYLNERLTNNSNDVIGSARFVGMGGAMGALGADISVMSWNPAGIGLFRKSDFSLSLGGQWNKSRIIEEKRGSGSFGQMGFVYSWKTDSEDCPFFNFGFNYQKKANYNYNFYADNGNLKGLSQMDQIAELADYGYDTNSNLAGMSVDNQFLTPIPDVNKPDSVGYYNKFRGERNQYTHHTSGSLQGFDMNFSANIRERGFIGLTVGMDNLRFRGWSNYYEENSYINEFDEQILGDYSLYNDYKIDGYGINVKLGTIFRPIAESSFRLGFVVETPTWYRLKSSTLFDLTDEVEGVRTKQIESYLEYTLRSPWKVRASMGSTVGTSFAWDVDYEFANYKGGYVGYPNYSEWDDYYGTSFSSTADRAMNQHTKDMLRGVHTLRAGMEYRPVNAWAFRLGYNYITSAYKDQVTYDQWSLNSAAMDYATSTSYMRTGPTNIMTLGIGYRYKKFYIDLAYKIRNQNGDFYAFDTSFTNPDSQFSADNPKLTGVKIDPVDVNLTRQNITCTLGFKF